MENINLFWIIFSYILGSIPFGYIITKFSTKKNILEIGWRKTSGSNVFKNIGKWQGALTGVLDLGKGFLAVKLAQFLGLSTLTQVLSGVAAVTGHNWSCFLNFAGGRGIGTFVGAGLALIPRTLGLSLIFPIILALIWNASIGTILLLITIIFLSSHFNQFETGGLFGLISLIPIFIKRLSPIKEIKAAKDKGVLIKNRLIFDDDKAYSEFRIKRIIRKLTKK
ncbi:MAG: glycerol-3-phosphate acyltransferase [Candidatus Nealsonbacteria bacterium]|nr:MAG: glycerol-3-phosphate acyltransferase [Candidatus Nealsonbacteria bacterium]